MTDLNNVTVEDLTQKPTVTQPDEVKTDVKVETKPEERISKVVGKVTKKEAELAKKEAEIAKKEEALKAQEELIKKFKEAPELAKKNPKELLKTLGIDSDEYLKSLLNDGEPTPEDKIKGIESKFAELEQKLEAREKALQEKEAQIAIHNFKQEIKTYVETNKDTACRLTKALGKDEVVYNVIEEHFTKTGEVLPIDKASEMVENHFVTEKKKEYEILKSYFENQTANQSTDNDDDDDEPVTFTKTLTNKTAQPTPQGDDGRILPKEESIKRIVAKYSSLK